MERRGTWGSEDPVPFRLQNPKLSMIAQSLLKNHHIGYAIH